MTVLKIMVKIVWVVLFVLFLFKNHISQESESLPGTISWVSPENLASSCKVSKEV